MEYINETKTQILKKKLLESIKIIKENLYDENGHIISDASLGIEERNKYIKLLQDYDEKLRKLENNEPVYTRIICLKEKKLPYKVIDDVIRKRQRTYDVTIPSKGIVKGICTCFEFPDGTYHDVIVLYKGFSDKYNTEFICYYDMSNNHVLVSPIFIKHNKMIRGICINQEMTNSLSTQFFNDTTNIDALKEIPSVINYFKVKHYEEYTLNVAISGNKRIINDKALDIVKSSNENNLNNYIYHYKAKFTTEELYEKVIIELKEANPNLIIYGEKCGWYDSFRNNFKDDCYVISMSASIDKVNEPNSIFKRGRYSYIQSALSIITENDYEKLKNKYNCNLKKCDDESLVKIFVNYLMKNNPNSQISFEYDEEQKMFKLLSSLPLSSINYGNMIKNAPDRICSKFRVDKNGYILTTDFDIIKYECNDNLELSKTLNVYVNDDILARLNKQENDSKEMVIDNKNTELNQNGDIEFVAPDEIYDSEYVMNMKKELDLLKQKYLSSQQEIRELKEELEYYKRAFDDKIEEHEKNL